jgi:hypothetical protein
MVCSRVRAIRSTWVSTPRRGRLTAPTGSARHPACEGRARDGGEVGGDLAMRAQSPCSCSARPGCAPRPSLPTSKATCPPWRPSSTPWSPAGRRHGPDDGQELHGRRCWGPGPGHRLLGVGQVRRLTIQHFPGRTACSPAQRGFTSARPRGGRRANRRMQRKRIATEPIPGVAANPRPVGAHWARRSSSGRNFGG